MHTHIAQCIPALSHRPNVRGAVTCSTGSACGIGHCSVHPECDYLTSKCTADLSQRRITTLYPNIYGNMISRSKDTYIAGLHIPIRHKIGVTKYLRGFCLSTQSVLRLTVLKYANTEHHMQRLTNTTAHK